MDRRPPEGPRDELETAFTPILRRVWHDVPSVLCAAFVDSEGECIDYVSSLDAFEAKVSAAHTTQLFIELRARQNKHGLAEPFALTIGASLRELWARRVTDEHLLVAISRIDADVPSMSAVLERAAEEFRREIGAEVPVWEPSPPLEVVVRPAVGWPYAPAAFTEEGGTRVVVSDVLGRWTERPEAPALEDRTCFRVRTDDGRELTLVHDPARSGWLVRT
jgi:hypothetical protein